MNQTVKTIMLGNSAVGKTSLLQKFIRGDSLGVVNSTIGLDFLVKEMEVDGCKIKFQLWDTCGQERFKSMTQTYVRNSELVLLVFDITDYASFEAIDYWLKYIEDMPGVKPMAKVIIGNKTDLENQRQVPQVEAEEFAKNHGYDYYETCKFNSNIELVFQDLCIKLHEIMKVKIRGQEQIRIKSDNVNSNRGCC